ncbi:hypothetical protein OQA88_6483 [Cercophora sp. LCS_1]
MAPSWNLPLSYDEDRRSQETVESSFEIGREGSMNLSYSSEEKKRDAGAPISSRKTSSNWPPRDLQPNSFYRPTPPPSSKADGPANGFTRLESVQDWKPNGCNFLEEPRIFRDESRKQAPQETKVVKQPNVKPPEKWVSEELGPSKPSLLPEHTRQINAIRDPAEEAFDAIFYKQARTVETASHSELASPAISTHGRTTKPLPPDEPLYMDIDPRIHWPQDHSEEWYEAKAEEIVARGGRKANFGKAAQRLRQKRIHAEPVPFEETLPEKIASNPAWVKMLRTLEGAADSGNSGDKTASGRGRKGMMKRQGSDKVNGIVNHNVNGHTNGNGVVNGAALNTKG